MRRCVKWAGFRSYCINAADWTKKDDPEDGDEMLVLLEGMPRLTDMPGWNKYLWQHIPSVQF